MYFAGNGAFQNFLVFAPMLNFIILDSNKNVTNCISTLIPSEKIKPFDTNLEPIISNLGHGRANVKFSNSVLVQKFCSSLYSNFILNLYIAYELNTWPHNSTNNFTLKYCLFPTVKLTINAGKSKFTYNGWGIAFDGKDYWSFDSDTARNNMIFGVDNNSSPYIDNPKSNLY